MSIGLLQRAAIRHAFEALEAEARLHWAEADRRAEYRRKWETSETLTPFEQSMSEHWERRAAASRRHAEELQQYARELSTRFEEVEL